MTALQKLRRLAPWLVGLFLTTQIVGVVPLMFDHTFHVFEDRVATSGHDHIASWQHGDHRHGTGDVKDECCTLYHLIGFLPFAVSVAPVSFTYVRITVLPPITLVAAGPDRLDRPPKSLLLI